MLILKSALILLLASATSALFGIQTPSLPSLPKSLSPPSLPSLPKALSFDQSKFSKGSGSGVITSLLDKAKNTTAQVVSAVVPDVNGTAFTTFKTLLTTVDSCIGSKDRGWSDPELGNFEVGKDSVYCNSACGRNFFCCAPQKPEDLTVNFLFSNSKDKSYELRRNDEESRLLMESEKPLVWIIHGLGNDIFAEGDRVFNDTKDAFLDRGYNVVVVDWHKGNRLYNQAMANVRIVGALTGQMIDDFGVANNSLCVGFSLGSHVCGEAGSWLKRKGQKLNRCIGIDPAGPGYDGCPPAIRLDKRDCAVVTSIHTSQYKDLTSLVGEQGLGTKVKTGECDFWANKGKEQPTCDNTTIASFAGLFATGQFGKIGSDLSYTLACSHSRGMQYFLSQVRNTCNFVGQRAECGGGQACARMADIENDMDNVDINGNRLSTSMSLPPDDKCAPNYDNDYTFDTTGEMPFC